MLMSLGFLTFMHVAYTENKFFKSDAVPVMTHLKQAHEGLAFKNFIVPEPRGDKVTASEEYRGISVMASGLLLKQLLICHYFTIVKYIQDLLLISRICHRRASQYKSMRGNNWKIFLFLKLFLNLGVGWVATTLPHTMRHNTIQ